MLFIFVFIQSASERSECEKATYRILYNDKNMWHMAGCVNVMFVCVCVCEKKKEERNDVQWEMQKVENQLANEDDFK